MFESTLRTVVDLLIGLLGMVLILNIFVSFHKACNFDALMGANGADRVG